MAQTKRFSIQAYDNTHYRRTNEYVRSVNSLIDAATKTIAESAAKAGVDPDKPFEYKDYPKVRDAMRDATKRLASRLTATIESGSEEEWLFACEKNDKFLESIMDTSKLAKGQLESYQDRNLDALREFQQRKVDGLDLSQRVWKYVGQYREQMETALDAGLGEGRSAQQLARDIKENLNDPDRLFRRVRDKRGNLVLSKSAKAFHPGTGVYRSSVRNAQRLARSEINMAYRESDWRRWQSEDFVVGIEVKRSNHTPQCKCPVCAKLVGQYPKAFKFIGWHPQCLCYAIPVLESDDETMEGIGGRLRAALHGEEYRKYPSKNTVADVPEGFKEWVKDNISAQDNWKSTPYFIRDNFVNGRLADGLNFQTGTIVPEMEVTALGSNVPDWEFKGENMKDSLWGRIKYFDESLEHCYGKNLELLDVKFRSGATKEEVMNKVRGFVNKGLAGVTQTDYKYVKEVFKYGMQGNAKCVANSINNLQALRAVKSADIPEIWRTAYNNAIREINAYDFTNGYSGVYLEIEKAYNIYKLAGLEDVKNFGYGKVSVNTPYNLFTEFKNEIPDIVKKLPPKEFCDMLKEFVPLVKTNSGRTSYIPAYKTVYISVDARCKVNLKQILVHEDSHAFDHQIDMRSKQDVKDTYNKWETTMKGDGGKDLKDKLNQELTSFYRKTEALASGEKDRLRYEFNEDLGVLSDIIGSARREFIRPLCHDKKYFSSEEKRLAEFVAHCFETYWIDLDYFKKLQPALYAEMRELAEKYR